MRPTPVRLTVRWMMAIVAVIGFDFGLVRGAYEADKREPCTSHLTLPALIFVPPLSLLSMAAVNVGLGVTRRGWASPFASGYLLSGCLASLGVCLDLVAGTCLLPSLLDVIVDPSTAPACLELEAAICALPQFALAVIGGGLASRYELTIVLRRGVITPGAQETVSDEV